MRGFTMKKYAVILLAVMLAGISSCADAVRLRFRVTGDNYVGEEAHAEIYAITYDRVKNVGFKVTSGDLPPGCYLEQAEIGARALMRGEPAAEGAFYFTVSVAIEYYSGGIDTGSTTCLMPVLPARNTNNNTNNNTGNNDTMSFEDFMNNKQTDTNTNNNSTEDPGSVSSSGGGGGGCESFPAISALILTVLTAFRKPKR